MAVLSIAVFIYLFFSYLALYNDWFNGLEYVSLLCILFLISEPHTQFGNKEVLTGNSGLLCDLT